MERRGAAPSLRVVMTRFEGTLTRRWGVLYVLHCALADPPIDHCALRSARKTFDAINQNPRD